MSTFRLCKEFPQPWAIQYFWENPDYPEPSMNPPSFTIYKDILLFYVQDIANHILSCLYYNTISSIILLRGMIATNQKATALVRQRTALNRYAADTDQQNLL